MSKKPFRRRHTLFAGTLLALGLFLTPARAVTPEYTDITGVAAAGHLRAQGQRLAKLWLQSSLDIQGDLARRRLHAGIERGEYWLQYLQQHARAVAQRRELVRADTVWRELRGALHMEPSPAAREQIIALAEELAIISGRLAMRIEQQSERPAAHMLDLSLRQNMLAQRLARLYLQAQSGDRSHGRLVDLEQSRREFASALQTLEDSEQTTPAIREALALARGQWLFFEQAVQNLRLGQENRPRDVASSSERIAEMLETVSSHYQQVEQAHILLARMQASSGTRRQP